jgi:hypothetical protein
MPENDLEGYLFHCIPVNDLREHVIDDEGTCWCQPEFDTEYEMFIHNSADGREDYEEGRRLPH